MSKSASKVRDVRSSVKREMASLTSRRSISVDSRARGSYVPEKKRSSSDERKSGGGNKLTVNRWAGVRKSSINLAEVKRKDARPLTDKVYQKRKAGELVELLDELGFSPSISVTKLMAPSKKDFENIFQFLYRYFDPTYEVKKIEEEAPKILKNLGYPFTVNKSAFVYVARTNWPSLLGVLVWLMDLSKFAMKVDMERLFGTTGDEKIEIHKILLRYICQCHHSGIDDEENENAVFTELIKSSVTDNLEELMEKNQEKKQLLISLEEKIKEHKASVNHSEMLRANIEKFEDFISKMQSHYQKKKEVCEQLMEELNQKESEFQTVQKEVSLRQDAYDAQGFDGKKHLTYFETQKKELSVKLDNKRTFVEELHDKIWEKEIEYSRRIAEMSDAAKSTEKLYNDITESLKSVLDPLLSIKTPQVQKVHNNFHLEFPVWQIQFNERSIESNRAFRNVLENIAEKVKSTNEILKRICASMNQKLTEIEMRKSEVSMRLKLLSIRENKQEQDLHSKKKVAVDEISALEVLCEKISQSIQILQDEKSELEKTYRAMIEEKNVLMQFREKKEKELEDYLIEQKEMFTYFSNTEEETLKLSESYGEEIVKKLEELKNL